MTSRRTNLADLERALGLDDRALLAVRDALLGWMREGLRGGRGRDRMLPAFVASPAAPLSGEAVALDAGGTRLRAARVRFESGRGRVIGDVVQASLPGAAGHGEASAEGFFDVHVDLVRRTGAPAGTPVGYCFSYPAASRPDGDAILSRWTKEVKVRGVVGRAVGESLGSAARRAGLAVGPIAVVNDTVAVLVAGTAQRGLDPASAVGLVVGTGTNIGAFLGADRVRGVARSKWKPDRVAVNFESGGFPLSGLGEIDDAVDAGSDDPGSQRFEKAVSGAYLGALWAEALGRLGLCPPCPRPDAETVCRAASADAGSAASRLARALLDRAADLVAAALAATRDLLECARPLDVCAEGSLFWNAPGFAARVFETLRRLGVEANSGRPDFGPLEHATLLGAARAALDLGCRSPE